MAKMNDKIWNNIIDELLDKFAPGELITHDYLEKLFLLRELHYDDFESQGEFLNAVKLLQFEYMTLVDKLRWDILEHHKLYLKNIRGDGYSFLIPKEQTDFAKEQAMTGIKKEMKKGFLILQNIRRDELTIDDRRRNADELAKLGQLQQILSTIR